jgi:glycosyltransferase involved in cell wall biosynthesis
LTHEPSGCPTSSPGQPDLPNPATVTVSMPYYRSQGTIRRAVDAVLAQTYPWLRLVVVNDGDTQTPPWPALADITDPRLTRVDLPTNRGRYFADAAVLAACDSEWWTVHDADDSAAPDWLETLLTGCLINGWVAAFGWQRVHGLNLGSVDVEQPGPDLQPTRRLRHLAHHAGIYRTAAVRAVGGPHPGYRIGYDTLLVNLVGRMGKLGVVPRVLYTRHLQPGSLSTSPHTGRGSPARQQARIGIQRLWARTILAGTMQPILDDISAELAADVAFAAHLIRTGDTL